MPKSSVTNKELSEGLDKLDELTMQFETNSNRFIRLNGEEAKIWQKSFSDTLAIIGLAMQNPELTEMVEIVQNLLQQRQINQEEMSEVMVAIGKIFIDLSKTLRFVTTYVIEQVYGEKKEKV
jgi:hypothetical protein